jgi:hypothetical protein
MECRRVDVKGGTMSLDGIKGKPARMQLPDGVLRDRRDDAAREALVRRIRAEFADMPGLSLTLNQASRLLGVDRTACARILGALTREGALRRNAQNLYVRADRFARGA